jgi:hypothetical protein
MEDNEVIKLDLDFDFSNLKNKEASRFLERFNNSALKLIFYEFYEYSENLLLEKIDNLFDEIGSLRGHR